MNRTVTGPALAFNVLAIIQAFLTLFSGAFLAASMVGGVPMLPPVYGEATAYPAELWALWFFAGHLCAAVGMWNGWSRAALAGVVVVAPAYMLLAVFALPAAYGDIITLHSMLVGAPIQILTGAVVAIYGGDHGGK